MATRVVMPKLGLVMKEGLVVLWHVEEGDEVEEGEVLLEIESDKVTVEVESSASGVVRKIIVQEEEIVPCGTIIAVVAEADEEIPDLDKIIADSRAVVMTRDEYMAAQALRETAVEDIDEKPSVAKRKTSPAAKRLAKERGIDLTSVTGTGPEGRIVRDDVLAAPEAGATVAQSDFEGRPGESVEMSKMRRSVADNMARSAHSVARVVLFAEVDMSRAVEYREANKESFKEAQAADLSYNVILIKAVASAMSEYPALNVSLDGAGIRKHDDINIGLAVALDDGLITVSIKHANHKELGHIARDAAELIEKARAGTFNIDDVTGGSITISSLGAYDIDCFTPVINLPEAAIIGVGAIAKKPVVRYDNIEVAPLMKLSLSFDHRLVDGATAATFLQILKNNLESMAFID